MFQNAHPNIPNSSSLKSESPCALSTLFRNYCQCNIISSSASVFRIARVVRDHVTGGALPRPNRGAKMAKQAALRPQSNALRRDGNGITSRGSLDADIIIANAPDPVFVSDL